MSRTHRSPRASLGGLAALAGFVGLLHFRPDLYIAAATAVGGVLADIVVRSLG